jgi:hypothetical protein
MAVIYLDSNAGGGNDGTSWTDAWGTFDEAVTDWGSGDVIYMDKGHTEGFDTSSKTFVDGAGTAAEPIPVWRVDKGSSPENLYAPTTGSDTAAFVMTGASLNFAFQNFHFHGIWVSGTNTQVTSGPSTSVSWYDCVIQVSNNTAGLDHGSSSGTTHYYKNCTIKFAANGQIFGGYTHAIFDDCTITAGTSITADGLVRGFGNRWFSVVFNRCDFSGIPNATLNMTHADGQSSGSSKFTYNNCKLPTPSTAFNWVHASKVFTNAHQSVEAWGCSDGVDSFPYIKATKRGTVEHTAGGSAVYATYVDSDSDTPMSIMLKPIISTIEHDAPLSTPDIVQWHNAVNTITVSVEGYEDFTSGQLSKANCWMEVYYFDTDDARPVIATTQVKDDVEEVVTTVADLATGDLGASDWSNETGGRFIKFEVTGLTVGKVGLIRAKVFLTHFESGKTLWIDPVLRIS